jgi:iron complex outermembrane receptor protein
VWTLARAASLLSFAFVAPLGAQTTSKDTTTTDSTHHAQPLDRVMISAVRGGSNAPISQKTITRAELQPRYFGQDVPLVLQGAAPSLTSYAETGNYWGYSYIRVRGLDQSRINLTLDGIPLNDPEDQVLYFADFPDLANSLRSVQVQRGVGTSSNGTAAYAGSINMETISPAATPAGGELQLESGSFGSRRASVDYRTGLLPSRFAFYARVSGLRTDGYRYHSGVAGQSLYASGGYFGDRDILKFTYTSGQMRDTMAYLAVPVTELATDRRINPLGPQERDGFAERLAALTYTRLLSPSSSVTTTVYRIGAKGDYDVQLDSLENFHLDFAWYGVTSAWSYQRDALRLDIGVNGNTYARDHYAFMRPDIVTPLYFNTGHKQDESSFAKVAYTVGRTTLFGDLQARHAEFRYTPDAHAGIAGSSIAWSFLNPKAGITYQLTKPLSLYASYGKNTREPARSDMFAGFDNLDTSNVAFVGDFHRVKPETVHDFELGATYHGAALDAQANVYSMDFRNEIAPIGALSYIGTPLRKNVGSSYRRGVEADVTYHGITRWLLSANASASMNRIREYTDSSGDTPVTYHNVEPLLTPRFQTYGRAQYAAAHFLDLAVEGRYQGESFLANTGDRRFVLPAATNVDGSATAHFGRYALVVRGNNLTNSKKYGSGYASDGVSYYYVLPPRNVFVTLKVGL